MKRTIIACALAAGTILGGCRTIPPSAWNYQIRPEIFASGAPKPAGEAIRSDENAVSRSAVNLNPTEAGGYDNVPETMKQLYDLNPLSLSQSQVIEETLAHNRDIKIQNYTLQVAEMGIPLSKGIYDLLLEATATVRKDQTATLNNRTTESARRSRELELAMTQLTPTGARARFAYAYTRLNQDAALMGAPFNPIITQGLTLSVTQPLLQGFGPTITNLGIQIAQTDRRVSALQMDALIQDQIQNALNLYWNLVFAVRSYDVQVISYAAAVDLLRINKAKVEAGVLPPTEVLQAQARAETRRDRIIRARQIVRDSEDRLKALMFFQDAAPNWDLQINPEQELSWREVEMDPQALLTEALSERPEILSRLANLDRRDFEIIRARDQLRPRLDFTLLAYYNGIGDSMHTSRELLNDGDNYLYEGTLGFSFPLQNRTARYALKQREIEKEQAKELYERERDRVTFDVRDAVREIQTSRERIDITRSRVEAEEANLNAERKRYEVGVSTAFQVLQFQDNLAVAQESHIQAIVDYNKAIIALERARGTILKTYGIEIASPDLNPPDHQKVGFPIGFN